MRKAGLVSAVLFSCLLIVMTGGWATLALFYRAPLSDAGRTVLAGFSASIVVLVLAALFTRYRWHVSGVYVGVLTVVLVWWNSIMPPTNVVFVPQNARQVTGSVNGNSLVLKNVRNFSWRTATDFDEQWDTRSYDLSKLRSMDLFMSYWAGPEMAHTIISFGFEGGEQVAWSIEARYRVGGSYSPIADAFKTDTLISIAAEERDIIGLRTNVRKEDVYIYRLKAPPEHIRAVLLGYVDDANKLSETPRFYNSITSNCTIGIVRILHLVGITVPVDWRLLLNGYLPGFLYENQLVDQDLPLAKLRESSRITGKYGTSPVTDEFSARIRDGIPNPQR